MVLVAPHPAAPGTTAVIATPAMTVIVTVAMTETVAVRTVADETHRGSPLRVNPQHLSPESFQWRRLRKRARRCWRNTSRSMISRYSPLYCCLRTKGNRHCTAITVRSRRNNTCVVIFAFQDHSKCLNTNKICGVCNSQP